MRITITGRAHMDGVSTKTGKPYNIHRIHCLGTQRGVEGQAAIVLTLDGAEYPYDKLRVGGEYIADFDSDGKLIDLTPVNPAAAKS